MPPTVKKLSAATVCPVSKMTTYVARINAEDAEEPVAAACQAARYVGVRCRLMSSGFS